MDEFYMRAKRFFLIYLFILIFVGIIFLYFVWETSMASTEVQALKMAMTAEVSFPTELISKLEVSQRDIEKTEYKQIKNSLIEFVAINDDIRFAYLYTQIEEKIYFVADSEPPTSEDYSPPGQEYTEADAFTFQVFEEDKPMITKPASDRWGTWVSVFVPIRDVKTNKVIAVFGVDYPADRWYLNSLQRTILSGIVVICILMLFSTAYIILLKNKALRDEKQKMAVLNDKLGEQEEFFRTIYEQSPLGITFGNFSDKIMSANSMFEKIVGRSREELSKIDWHTITHPDDLQNDSYQFESFKKGEIDGYSIMKRYLRPDQTYVWVNMTRARIKIKNIENFGYICIFEDISERVKAELMLRESERSNAVLLSNLPGMAYRCNYDRDWTMYFVSEGCFELTGYRPESLLLNRDLTFNDLIQPKFKEILWDKWNHTLRDRVIFKEEYSITTALGDVKWVYEQGQGVYNDNGEVEAIEGLIIDISERKMKEDEINYINYHDTLTGLYNRRFFEEEKQRCDCDGSYPLSVIIGDINGLKLINDSLGHTEGDRLINTIAKILLSCCREVDIIARTGGDEFSILLPNTNNEKADRMIKKILGTCEEFKSTAMEDVYHISISLGCATKLNENENLINIIKDAEDSMYRHKMLQSRSLHSSFISSMKSTLFEKSQETEEHAQRLIFLSNMLGQRLKLVEKQLNELELLSTLHDIGKIGISDAILNKPGKLTAEEWVDMKKHPEIGYRIAMSTPELAQIAEYILYHHERWDGKGYPQGLKEKEIPLLSRIIAIADAYDAMITDRPYRLALPKKEALEEIKRNAGAQFDPELAELFLEDIVDRSEFLT